MLHFQPVMDTQLGRVSGAEALIRWNHPDRGMIPPGLFIPMAEEAGLIDQIGLWVMRDACRQAAAWEGDMRVAINLSARQFLDKDLDAHQHDPATLKMVNQASGGGDQHVDAAI